MTARSPLLVALALVVALLGLAGGTAHAAGQGKPRAHAPARADVDPLRVHIDSISPSTLSDDDRPITITGTVTNQSDEPWTEINLYAFRSLAPLVDASTLAASATIEDDAFVGERVITPGTEDTVAELEPDQTQDFSLTVPRSELTISEPGVYWLGVHASGISSLPRDDFMDGRARTFIPLVPASKPAKGVGPATVDSVESAIVVPIRQTVWLTPDGRVDKVGRWARSLGVGGRLHSLLSAGDSGSEVPLTWLVDPAVPAAVARLAAGNPARSLAPDPAATETPTESPTEQPDTPEGGAPADPDPYATASDPVPQVVPGTTLTESQQQVAAVAQAWLDRFKQLTADQTVLSLPFGDLDVSAAAAHGSTYYQQAVRRSSQVMDYLGVRSTPAIAPRDGILSPAAIEAATPDSTILVADTSFAEPPDAPQSLVRLLDHKVIVTSSGAAAGGPGPTAAADPLALRQRLLSEAALRLQSGSTAPVVMMLPADWQSADSSRLFDGLDVPWLRPVEVADLALRSAVSVSGNDLAYLDEDEQAELGIASFSAADRLTARGTLLSRLLSQQNLVRQQVADESLMGLSVGHRANREDAVESTAAASDFITDQLDSVTIDAPDAVTLSSESGPLGADIVNGLDQPVTVRIAARSDGGLRLEDLEEIQLNAGARTRILPTVRATEPGIHQLELLVTDLEGAPLGGSTAVQIRAAQVSGIIWLLIAGGALLLFGTIAVRLVRRIRGRGGDEEATTDPGEPADEPTTTHVGTDA
ncbi:hypothetical protein C7S10_09165 [Nocardioides currus]|uniref:Glycoprotein n=2 Tax=Nocardioides currus TaxID=2133958 RepID=A0A2R7YZ83_9ACTN|nr:hypothetical protein C7S10_09165 [Nocardioides currus]